MASWSFLTNHAVVLTYISQRSDSTGRQIAEAIGITERAVRKILADLQATMEKGAGMFREEAAMDQCLKELESFKERVKKVSAEGNRMFNPGWHVALDLRNMLAVAEAIVRAAKERKESRGGHTRTDFTGYSKEFAKKRFVVRQKGEKMEVVREDLPQIPKELEDELVNAHLLKPEILKQLRGEA